MMRLRFYFCGVAIALLMGCQPKLSAPDSPPTPVENQSGPGHFIIAGNVAGAGRHPLEPGDTVAMVLGQYVREPPGKPMTIMLVRRAPEGKTRQLIQLDASGRLMDPSQNLTLRDGDELDFPGSTGSLNLPEHDTPH